MDLSLLPNGGFERAVVFAKGCDVGLILFYQRTNCVAAQKLSKPFICHAHLVFLTRVMGWLVDHLLDLSLLLGHERFV